MIPTSAPYRAVILAAGLGSRLRPLTDDHPKPLVEVRGVPILHNALRNLAAIGVREATLVVGYRHEVIEQRCGDSFAGMRINYVRSDVFDRTGSAYSLWLAREALLSGDALLLEGDVFFDTTLLPRLLNRDGDVAAVDRFDNTMSGSAALVSAEGRVLEFRMSQTATTIGGAPFYKTVNIYRFGARTLEQVIVPALDRLVAGGERKSYVEQVLAQLIESGALRLKAAICSDSRWFEIDDHADLQRAEQIFHLIPRIDAPGLQPQPA